MCPACRQPMVIIELEGVEVDHCLVCRGTWLDAGEIEIIADRAGADAGRLSGAIEGATRTARSARRCPRCRRRLRQIHLERPAGLELDACPRGHGLWFDRGEMRALVGSASDGADRAVAEFFGRCYRGELETDGGVPPDRPGAPE
ncbi:MAG: zf-TFIIB domain-containing protein [Phycisphaerae bacterium]